MPRKEKKYHFIYKTTCKLTNRYYIGMHSTDILEDGYLGSGDRLRYSIRKYGKENHQREILEFCDSREELKKREEEIVTLNEIAKEECMNLALGVQGGKIWTDDKQDKIKEGASIYQKEKWKNDSEYREKISNVLRENMKRNHQESKIKYDTFKDKKHSEESKQKMSEKAKERKGSKNSQYGTCWVTNGTENKKIKKEDLELWESKGFTKGRKLKTL